MREHRSEWADNHIDAYSASAIKLGPCSLPGSRAGNFGGQVILPLAHTIEHEELLEVVMMEGAGNCHEDALMSRDMFLLQLRSGMDENAVGMCSELIFAPIDASFADDAPLLPSGFRIIPRESDKEASSPNRTLNLASALEIKGSEVNVNLAGLPTLVLPCGFIKNGISRLPVGFQLIGAVFDEEKLLRVKHIFEQTLQGCSFIPPLIADEFRC